MRDKTIVQAQDEIDLLDKIGVQLSDTLRAGHEQLRANSPTLSVTALCQLLKRVKCAQSHVVQPSLNFYIHATS
jgi:hypothetical protein